MSETSPARRVTRFGAFEVDMRAGELRKNGLRIKLQVQPFRVLQILLENPGEVVTREEMQRQIWPANTFVDFDRGLNNAVKRLRGALGDCTESPRYVETLAKRGYRFIAEVEEEVEEPASLSTKQEIAAQQSVSASNHVRKYFGSALLIAFALIVVSSFVPTGKFRPQARAVNVKALGLYDQGKHHLDRVGQGFADGESKLAGDYFQMAIDADPTFVQAYVGLVNAHESRLMPTSEDLAVIDKAQIKIMELAPDSSNAAMFSARAKQQAWAWPAAEAEYWEAIARDPNNVDAHRYFAKFLDDLGRLDEGWKELQVAQEIDPYPDRLPTASELPEALSLRGKCDQAISLALKILEGSPNDGQTHLLLSYCYGRTAKYEEAIKELGRTCSLYGYPEIEKRLNRTFHEAGYEAALRQWAREIETLQSEGQAYFPAYLASIYATLGEKDRAFYWLEDAYRFHLSSGLGSDLVHWLKDPSLRPLQDDPRYLNLLRRVGIPR